MATSPFTSLPLILSKRQQEMLRLVTGVVQKASAAGGEFVVRQTPVKRGIARSNWVASIDHRFSAVIPAYVPYPSLDNGPAPLAFFHETGNAAAAIVQHKVALASFNPRRNGVVYIQNNVPHIAKLNSAHSKQNVTPNWFGQVTEMARRALIGTWKLKA